MTNTKHNEFNEIMEDYFNKRMTEVMYDSAKLPQLLSRYKDRLNMYFKGGENKVINEIKKLYGLQDTLRDIEKSELFKHVPFEEYASTLDELFDLVEEESKNE